MGDAITKSELARRFGVSPSSVTRWVQSGKLKPDANGRIPAAEVERLTAELKSYSDQHGATLAAVEGLAVQLGTRRGDLMRRAVTVAEDLIRLATAWHDGAEPDANSEIAEDLRSRIATLGLIAEGMSTLEEMFVLLPELLPPTPKRQLLELSMRVGQMDPQRAVELIAPMSEADATEKLREFADFSPSAGHAPLQQEQ